MSGNAREKDGRSVPGDTARRSISIVGRDPDVRARFGARHGVLSCLGMGLVGILLRAGVADAGPMFTAKSTISWGFGQDDIVTRTGTTTGGGYSLGNLNVQIINIPRGLNVTTPAKDFRYKFDSTDTLGPLTRSLSSGPLGNTTTVTAQADMTIGPKPANYVAGTPVPYLLSLTAKSDTDPFSPDGYATAKGGDPQIISSAGVFGGVLSIGAGSSVFGTRPGVDLAEATFQLTAFGLSAPIATLDITSGDGHVNAAVHFSSDPRLSFFEPGVLDPGTKMPIPITESEVKNLLQGDPYLGTTGGTLSALNLFTYRYDMSGVTLTPDAALGSDAVSTAFSTGGSVPEPPSSLLLGCGLLGVIAWRLWPVPAGAATGGEGIRVP